MENPINLKEKYERNGWFAVKRPDLEAPPDWSLSMLTALERIRSHTLSSRGVIACIKDGETFSDVFTLPADGGWLGRITTDRPLAAYWDDEVPAWSPDGTTLAFGLHGSVQLVSMPPSGSTLPKKLTDFTAASSPRWMPDSHGLIITVERHEADQLVLTDRSGSWLRALTDDALGDHWDARPSPDGRHIVFNLRRFDDLNRLDIVLLELASAQQVTLYGKPSNRASTPKWSPDGRWISFISQESGWDELYLIQPDGEGLHALTAAGQDIVQYEWSPSGTRILAVINRGGAFTLNIIEVDTGLVHLLCADAGLHSNPNWACDESYVTFEFESPSSPPDVYRMNLPARQVTRLTFSEPPALQAARKAMPQAISYHSFDGLEIPAFLYLPEKQNGAAIVYPHGGPKDQYGFIWDDLAQYFVAKGYTYLAPNYRGSTGYGRDFERANYNDWGVGDTQDCLHAARTLSAMPHINPGRIGISGGSYGGYMTINCLSRDPDYLYACGVTKYGDSNLVTSWAQCEKRLRRYTEIFLGHPADAPEVYQKGSPIHEVRNVQKPVLVLHGLLDSIVPPEASEEWVEALRREGKTFEYKTYAGEPHGFLRRENLHDAYQRIERFLDWYLLPR